jgi:hypothetical protein
MAQVETAKWLKCFLCSSPKGPKIFTKPGSLGGPTLLTGGGPGQGGSGGVKCVGVGWGRVKQPIDVLANAMLKQIYATRNRQVTGESANAPKTPPWSR